jgi:hypothetical protein
MATLTSPPPSAPPVTPSPVEESSLIPKKLVRARPLFDPEILRRALKDSVLKLNPVTLMKNPVIFVVEVGAVLVLLVVSLVMLLTFVALAIDLGMLAVARTQCQDAADAAAIPISATISCVRRPVTGVVGRLASTG